MMRFFFMNIFIWYLFYRFLQSFFTSLINTVNNNPVKILFLFFVFTSDTYFGGTFPNNCIDNFATIGRLYAYKVPVLNAETLFSIRLVQVLNYYKPQNVKHTFMCLQNFSSCSLLKARFTAKETLAIT